MILFAILVIMLLIMAIFITLTVSVGGVVAIVCFGDVIICVALILFILKKIFKKKKK